MKVQPMRLLQALEKALLIPALLLFSRAFALLFENGSGMGALVQQVLYLLIFGIVVLLILLRLGRFAFVALSDWYTLLLIGFIIISTIWSVNPGETVRSLIVFLGATALGIYLAARFSLGEQMRLLIWVLLISAVLSLFFGLFLDIGIMRDGLNAGSWRGIFGHKNDLGRYMALLVVLLWVAGRHQWVAWGAVVLAVGLTLLSKSATSLLTLGGMALALALYRVLQWRNTRIIPVLIAGGVFFLALVMVVVLANTTWVLEQLGKDLTFTGRTALWVDVWAKIGERPWLGFGYNAFWLGMESEAGDIWRNHGWRPNHAHNGYFDLWLELGLVGLLLTVAHVLFNTRHALRWTIIHKSVESLWPLAYITLLFMLNFNYSVLISQSVFFWVVYLAATYRTKLELRHYTRLADESVSSNSNPNLTLPPPSLTPPLPS